MDPILVPERRELHLDEGIQGQDAEGGRLLRLVDVGGRQGVVGADFLASEDDVDGVASPGAGAVEEHVDPGTVAVGEPGRLQGRPGGVEVGAAEDEVDVLGVPHRRFIDPGHPGRHGVAADHGMRDAGLFQGLRGPPETFAHLLHGSNHPFPGGIVQDRVGHFRTVSPPGTGRRQAFEATDERGPRRDSSHLPG